MWRKLPRRDRVGPSYCAGRTGNDARMQPRNPHFFSPTRRGSAGVDAWSLWGRPGSCIKELPFHLPSGAMRRALKLRREAGHRAKAPYPFSPLWVCAPHSQGLVQVVGWGRRLLKFGLARSHPPLAQILLLGGGREPLEVVVSHQELIMSHKALGPWGVHPEAG